MNYYHKCPDCQAINSTEDWDLETIKLARNRKERRLFRTLSNMGELTRWYVCPTCKRRVQKSNIVNILNEGEIDNAE